jgi:predicted DNA-binding transcriptional regulator YafY
MRNGFRHFRADRVVDAQFLEVRYTQPRARLRAQWKKEMREDWERRKAHLANVTRLE